MEKTLQVLNRMVADGVIDSYAIGGAVAAIYYLEPFDTADLDVFFTISTEGSDLALLAPIYEYLEKAGFHARSEFVYIEGLPVQFLPVFNPLIDESVADAVSIKYGDTPTRIIDAEHLVAIMLDTGRPNDFARIGLFLGTEIVDREKLNDILNRHGLMEKWNSNQQRFGS